MTFGGCWLGATKCSAIHAAKPCSKSSQTLLWLSGKTTTRLPSLLTGVYLLWSLLHFSWRSAPSQGSPISSTKNYAKQSLKWWMAQAITSWWNGTREPICSILFLFCTILALVVQARQHSGPEPSATFPPMPSCFRCKVRKQGAGREEKERMCGLAMDAQASMCPKGTWKAVLEANGS